MAQQEDGCFPRLNGALIQSGKFDSAIVSVVGKFIPSKATDGTLSFRCADNVEIVINPEQMMESPQLDFHDGPVVEVVGQVSNGMLAAFVTRTISKDFDLDVYNKLLDVLHNQKFKQYFGTPFPNGSTIMGQ